MLPAALPGGREPIGLQVSLRDERHLAGEVRSLAGGLQIEDPAPNPDAVTARKPNLGANLENIRKHLPK